MRLTSPDTPSDAINPNGLGQGPSDDIGRTRQLVNVAASS